MPSVAQFIIKSGSVTLGTDDVPDGQQSETIPLYLPSSLPGNLCGSPAILSLVDKGLYLWKAQADESLEDIQQGQYMITGLIQFKKLNILGTSNTPHTCLCTFYESIQGCIH